MSKMETFWEIEITFLEKPNINLPLLIMTTRYVFLEHFSFQNKQKITQLISTTTSKKASTFWNSGFQLTM